MTNIDKLKNLTHRTPRSLWEWLDLYSEEDQEVIINAILHADTSQAYEALRSLEPHPYPFHKTSIAHHRRQLRLGGHK